MKYRKKPVVIEATQWFKHGDHPEVRMPNYSDVDGIVEDDGVEYESLGWIDTLEGGHIVRQGDWIITGVKGEHYPCKPGIFEMTYEPVKD